MSPESQTPAASYVAAAAPPGTIDHAALLMTAEPLRRRAAAAIALGGVIGNIPNQGKEPEIRALKLNWWIEEMERTGKGQARHPLTVELSALAEDRAWLAPLGRLVGEALRRLSEPVPATLAELLPRCHGGAERHSLVAAALPGCSEPALANARSIGTGIALAETLAEPDCRHDRDELARLATGHLDDIENLAANDFETQRTVYVQAYLHRRLIEKRQAAGFNGEVSIGPLGLLWHGWRGARKLGK